MAPWLTILLLVIANVFMTFAWYGHLKLQQMKVVTDATPLWVIILISWGMALLEYILMVPANRYGFAGNGGHFTLPQLKVMQEAITLVIFALFTVLFFKDQQFHWNHAAAALCLLGAVYFVFK